MKKTIGRHFVCAYSGCDQETLDNPSVLETLLRRTASLAGMHPHDARFVTINPNGVTGQIQMREGFISIRTIPETLHATLEFFTTANSEEAEKALARLHEFLGASHYSQKSEDRTRSAVNEPDLKI